MTLILGLGVALAVLAAGFWVWKRRVKRYALHMKHGAPTITGLIVHRGLRRFVLIRAELEEGEDQTQLMGGHVEVLRENVFCIQEIE